jgi:hypothetical protein
MHRAESTDVALDVITKLRSVCLGLPEAYEEPAWVGRRWRIRKRTFAHVLVIESGWPPVYARAAGDDGRVTVITFRSSGGELAALSASGRPFFKPLWPANMGGMILAADSDWAEVAELLTESYRLLAPKKLVGLVDQPAA